MTKTRILASTLSTLSLVGSLTLPTILSCSAPEEEEIITNIALYPDSDTIRPGETVIIRAVVEPSKKRTNDLIWELVDCPSQDITLSNDGVLIASPDLEIGDLLRFKIKATAPNNQDVSQTINMTALPEPTYDFQGFENNEVQYLDRAHNIRSVNLQKSPDGKIYWTEHPIDIFEMDQDPRPEGWKSFIKFVPKIAGQAYPYFRFDLKNGPYAPHAISWIGYEDGDWTTTIPDFMTYNAVNLFDTVEVSFACDPDAKLIINFDCWNNQWRQLSQSYFDYYSPTDATHSIIRTGENVFRCNLHCPAYTATGTHEGSLSSIYCFRPRYEYTEFNFELIKSSLIDPSLDEMLEITLPEGKFEPELETRTLDHFRYYKFDLDYSFKLDGRKYTADHFNYEPQPLFTIEVTDPLFDEKDNRYVACTCDFYVDWIFE